MVYAEDYYSVALGLLEGSIYVVFVYISSLFSPSPQRKSPSSEVSGDVEYNDYIARIEFMKRRNDPATISKRIVGVLVATAMCLYITASYLGSNYLKKKRKKKSTPQISTPPPSRSLFLLAHLHHFYERYSSGTSLKTSVISSIAMFAYTSAFGWFATFVFLRTSSTYACIFSHIYCNLFGLPDISALFSLPNSHSRIGYSSPFFPFPYFYFSSNSRIFYFSGLFALLYWHCWVCPVSIYALKRILYLCFKKNFLFML
ncbi:CAAX prenyl protease 2 [Smittium mucronatum]|uniref:intramembrane prenyl-peptidase Rce1 n=1 Tax=Smittium mucronatum TaxID=133383 RepID=A0A1R0H3I5_9FUNG|nr:CAAX prenyl protease 2 [Smittium mucronatum]